jgi:hypothetical protein
LLRESISPPLTSALDGWASGWLRLPESRPHPAQRRYKLPSIHIVVTAGIHIVSIHIVYGCVGCAAKSMNFLR